MPHTNGQSKCTWTCDMSQEAFCAKIYTENADRHRQTSDKCFVRACPVDMHMDGTKEAFCAEIYGRSDTTWIEHRPLTVTARTPQCGHPVWAKNMMTLGWGEK